MSVRVRCRRPVPCGYVLKRAAQRKVRRNARFTHASRCCCSRALVCRLRNKGCSTSTRDGPEEEKRRCNENRCRNVRYSVRAARCRYGRTGSTAYPARAWHAGVYRSHALWRRTRPYLRFAETWRGSPLGACLRAAAKYGGGCGVGCLVGKVSAEIERRRRAAPINPPRGRRLVFAAYEYVRYGISSNVARRTTGNGNSGRR